MSSYIKPNWPAPNTIKAYCSTRIDGFSKPPYQSFNLGDHVEDETIAVKKNRAKLHEELNLPSSCLWLQQVHGNTVINTEDWQKNINADGSYSHEAKKVCAVMTADCLPILACNKSGTEVMALHGGWRSLASGIIEQGLKHFQSKPSEILVWLGPAIGPKHFEVGHEVREQFLQLSPNLIICFQPSISGRWLMDIYQTAKLLLNQLGVTEIYGGEYCTYSEDDLFFSYRREGQTGRMVSLIYFG